MTTPESPSSLVDELLREAHTLRAGPLGEILTARRGQNKRMLWQDFPNGTSQGRRRAADAARAATRHAANTMAVTWLHLLEDQATAAAAEEDPARLRAHLVELGATVLGWIEAIDRQAQEGQ